MKKVVLLSLVAASITLQAGLFDSFAPKAESLIEPQKSVAAQSDLLSTLTGSLGVTKEQAAGGTAALMQAAASKIPSANYNEILKSVPGLDAVADGESGMLNRAAGMLGGGSSLAKTFESLGMEGSMIGKFVPVILEFSGKYVSKENLSLLKTALGSVL